MADAVTAVPGTRRLGEGWSLRAESIEMLNGNNGRALVGVWRGLKLLVTRSRTALPTKLVISWCTRCEAFQPK